MIIDTRNEFADGVAVSGAAATRNVGSSIDLSVVRDIGQGQPLYFVVLVEVAPTGADTVKFQLTSDATDPNQTDGSQTVHIATDDVAIASLPAGTRFVLAVPAEGPAYEQFLNFQAVNVGAGALASLVVSAFLSLDPAGNKAYPDALPKPV